MSQVAVLLPDGEGGFKTVRAGFEPPQASEELGLTQGYDQANLEATRGYMQNFKRLQAYEEVMHTDAMNTARQWWNMAARTTQQLEQQFLQHQGNVNALTQQMLAGHVERIAAVNGVAIESMLESVGIRASERMESNVANQTAVDLIAQKTAHAFAQQVNSETISASVVGRLSAQLLDLMKKED